MTCHYSFLNKIGNHYIFYNTIHVFTFYICFEFEIKFQVKKLVQKCISRDSMHYRKITDKPLPGQGGEKEEEAKEIKVIDTEKLAVGKYNLWSEEMEMQIF